MRARNAGKYLAVTPAGYDATAYTAGLQRFPTARTIFRGMPAKPQFEPLHQGHAIEQMALVVNFQRLLDLRQLRAAREAIGKPAALPAVSELRTHHLTVGPNMMPADAAIALGGVQGPVAPAAPAGVPPLAGYSFSRVAPDGSEEMQLMVLKHQISFRTTLYTRWATVIAEVRALLTPVLPIFVGHSPVTAIAMNYADKFVCMAAPIDSDVTQLLRRDSPYLAPTVFEAKDLWHCHTGAFSNPDPQTKRLVSVNIDMIADRVDDRDRTTLSIASILTDGLNHPGYSPTVLSPEGGMDFIFQRFDALHALDKALLRSIILPAAAQRIALDQ